MKTQLTFTHHHVAPNLYDFFSPTKYYASQNDSIGHYSFSQHLFFFLNHRVNANCDWCCNFCQTQTSSEQLQELKNLVLNMVKDNCLPTNICHDSDCIHFGPAIPGLQCEMSPSKLMCHGLRCQGNIYDNESTLPLSKCTPIEPVKSFNHSLPIWQHVSNSRSSDHQLFPP